MGREGQTLDCQTVLIHAYCADDIGDGTGGAAKYDPAGESQSVLQGAVLKPKPRLGVKMLSKAAAPHGELASYSICSRLQCHAISLAKHIQCHCLPHVDL